MGLTTLIKGLMHPDHRAERRQRERERRDHHRQNKDLLEIALKKGRMQSFTPDDLPAFYRMQQEKREREEREASLRSSTTGRTRIELGEECDSAILVGGHRREAVVVPQEKQVTHRLDAEHALREELKELQARHSVGNKGSSTPEAVVKELERDTKLFSAIVEAKLKLLALLMQDSHGPAAVDGRTLSAQSDEVVGSKDPVA